MLGPPRKCMGYAQKCAKGHHTVLFQHSRNPPGTVVLQNRGCGKPTSFWSKLADSDMICSKTGKIVPNWPPQGWLNQINPPSVWLNQINRPPSCNEIPSSA
jgi:hypothetical protein